MATPTSIITLTQNTKTEDSKIIPKLESELKAATTQEEMHNLLRICDALYKNEHVENYIFQDLPSDEVYEECVKISNYPSTVIIQNIDNRTHISTSPKVMNINQILNSFIFNRYEYNKNKVEAIVYFLTSKHINNSTDLTLNSGDIKIQFNRLVDQCLNKPEQECFNYFLELGVNYDIIEDLVKMIQYVNNYEANDVQSKYLYINKQK